MPVKLPGPSFGTAEHAEPKTWSAAIIEPEGEALIVSLGMTELVADGVEAAGAELAVVDDDPQAASARGRATTTAAMPARRAVERRVGDAVLMGGS
jgi:hypothetical protein